MTQQSEVSNLRSKCLAHHKNAESLKERCILFGAGKGLLDTAAVIWFEWRPKTWVDTPNSQGTALRPANLDMFDLSLRLLLLCRSRIVLLSKFRSTPQDIKFYFLHHPKMTPWFQEHQKKVSSANLHIRPWLLFTLSGMTTIKSSSLFVAFLPRPENEDLTAMRSVRSVFKALEPEPCCFVLLFCC